MKKFLQNLALIFCIVVFCLSVWNLFGIWQEYHAGDEIYDSVREQASLSKTKNPADPSTEASNLSDETSETSDPSIPASLVDLNSVKEINEDTIGWIQIPDTSIDYPILQAEDNDQYLRRTITGESNKAGSIFADYRVEKPFEEANTLIYGHNLLNGKMFSNLMKYEEKDWWEEHPLVYIQTEDSVLTYEVYACYRTRDTSYTYTFGMETETGDYQNYLDYSLNHALYSTGIKPKNAEQTLTLSTCTNDQDTERFIVHARKITP